MKKNDWLFLLFFTIFYIFYLLFFKSESVKYKFNPQIIEVYKRSQDINADVKNRTFISDSDIYLSSGYLYAKGEAPTSYNFQHPPLVKYLFGFSIELFKNPFIVQFIFGVIFIYLTYFLGIKIFKNSLISVFAAFLVFFDPVFQGQLDSALLDLGQATFCLGYIISFLFLANNLLLQGVLLGLFAASKFWTAAVVIFAFLNLYAFFILKRKFDYKKILLTVFVAFLVFSATYFKSFIDTNLHFNIIFQQLKMLKFMIQHNFSPVIGSSILLFLTGRYPKWWGDFNLVKADIWNILWPISLAFNLAALIRPKMDREQKIIFLITPLYLLTIINGVAFSRYFLIIFPYLYLVFSNELVSFLKRNKFLTI